MMVRLRAETSTSAVGRPRAQFENLWGMKRCLLSPLLFSRMMCTQAARPEQQQLRQGAVLARGTRHAGPSSINTGRLEHGAINPKPFALARGGVVFPATAAARRIGPHSNLGPLERRLEVGLDG